jgi:hypothetical protein
MVVPVAAAVVIYKGAIVALNSAGYAVPAANTAGLRVIGVAAGQADNTAVGASAGDVDVIVDRGTFKLVNGTAALAQANVGFPCFVQDDATVGKGGASNSAGVFAGIFEELDADGGAWVNMSAEVLMEGMNAGVEAVAAPGAISVLTRLTHLAVDGTDAFTLADGVYEGQRKTVTVLSGANTPVGTVTPATPHGHASVTAFGAIGDTCTWEWHFATGWMIVAANGVTVA